MRHALSCLFVKEKEFTLKQSKLKAALNADGSLHPQFGNSSIQMLSSLFVVPCIVTHAGRTKAGQKVFLAEGAREWLVVVKWQTVGKGTIPPLRKERCDGFLGKSL